MKKLLALLILVPGLLGGADVTVSSDMHAFLQTANDSAARTELGALGTAYEPVGVYRTVPVPAGAMIPRTTNGAEAATQENATNDIMEDVMLFDAGATVEGVGFWVNFTDQWDAGTVKVKFSWTAASGSGGVTWGIAGQSYADSAAIDQALGTRVDVDDTLITAVDLHTTAASAAVTIADAAAGDWVYFEITRQTGDANDTLAVDAELLGVTIQYLESSTEQAAW